MDELEKIKEAIAALKETLIFLTEQEKVRGDEVAALNEKIDSVNETVVEKIINPSIEAYNEGKYNEFKDAYGERLSKFDNTLKTSMNDPEYDATREAWDTLSEMPEEERGEIDVDKYVDSVEEGLTNYVSEIKKSLGISEDTAVEITEDGNGDIEVKADENGDGEPETVVSEETTTEEALAPEEEVVEETVEEDGEPTQEEIDAYLRGDDLKK